MNAYEYELKRLVETHSKTELAEQIISQREVAHAYYNDNVNLRAENESLRYLIGKYRMGEV